MSDKTQWQPLCQTDDLIPHSGIAAWTEAGPVAIFWLPGAERELYAIGHYDPIAQANVLARGIVGDLDGQIVVASPLYKQHFDLDSGVCLEDDSVQIPTYPVLVDGDTVMLEVPVESRSEALA